MNFTNTKYYEILGVTHDAKLESISRAKDRLKFGSPEDRAPFNQWDLIDEAYGVLSDVEKRRQYDRYLKENGIELNKTRTYAEFLEEKAIGPVEEQEEKKFKIDIPDEIDDTSIDNNVSNQEIQNTPVKQQNESSFGAPAFTHLNEKFEDMSFEYQMKTIGKYVGVALLINPALAAVIGVWMRKHKGKIKLQKDNRPKRITEAKMIDLELFKEYEQKLNADIDKIISEPHNNYKLEIDKKKYENQIDLLQKKLEVRTNKRIKNYYEMFINKLQIRSIVKQLATASKNLEGISKKIENYKEQKTPRLARLNEKLIENTKKIVEIEQNPNKTLYGVKKLEVRQNKLLHKRDEKGTAIKNRVVRLGNFYDGIVKAKDFIVSYSRPFISSEQVYEDAGTIQEEISKSV